jgi:DNA replication protein DnaC|nr:MAG TPA: replicative helicase [Caudoviricetes sp.]
MYDVKEFKFNREKCWFRANCPMYNAKDCNCSCSVYFQYYYLVNLANIPPNKQQPEQLKLSADKDIKKYEYLNNVKENINEFVQDGCNLYLYSPYYGNGKTTWSIKLMSKYFSNIWNGNGTRCRGLFINVDEFLMAKRNAIKHPNLRLEEMEKLIPTVDLVIWDDIGVTKLKEYDHQILFSLINPRIVNNKANIFTSNVIDDQLDENIGGRLANRILDTSTIVEFTNKPQRKPREVRI